MSYTVTPQSFFDLYVLAAYWLNPEADFRVNRGWNTVDKVCRILNGLGVLSDKQRKAVYKDRRTQSLFLMKSKVVAFGHFDNHTIAASGKILVIADDLAKELNREKMLRNMRIYLTEAGRTYARSIEAKYASVCTRERFLVENDRQEAMITERAKAAVVPKYNKRVEQETS